MNYKNSVNTWRQLTSAKTSPRNETENAARPIESRVTQPTTEQTAISTISTVLSPPLVGVSSETAEKERDTIKHYDTKIILWTFTSCGSQWIYMYANFNASVYLAPDFGSRPIMLTHVICNFPWKLRWSNTNERFDVTKKSKFSVTQKVESVQVATEALEWYGLTNSLRETWHVVPGFCSICQYWWINIKYIGWKKLVNRYCVKVMV